MSAFDWFGKWNIYNPGKIAVKESETGITLTYGQLHKVGCRLAHWLMSEKGLTKGDRIAVMAENCLEYIALFSVAQKTGIILVPLNYRLTARETGFLLSDSQPSLLIFDKKYSAKLEGTESFHSLSSILTLDELSALCKRYAEEESIPEFENVLFDEDHPLFIIYTSGTTAFPKGSVYTHKMLLWNAINTAIRLDITSDDRSINCAPPFHTGSWNVLMTPFFLYGAYTLVMPSFNPESVLEAIEREKMSIFWAVPTMLKMLSESAVFESTRLNSLRYIIVGGEAMPIPLIEFWHSRGIAIRQGYGLTEVGPNVTSLNHTDAIRKQGSIGTPNFFYLVKIIDSNGNEIKSEGTGELLLKGPNVTPGYWNNPSATAQAIRDGWFYTGDMVRRDSEGFLFVVDRIKNMYISGGENVYPAEIEYLIRQHPAVDQVAIIGVADMKWGETGLAFIVLKQGENVSKEQLTQYCRASLAKYKIPGHFEFIDELPKNDAGKIDRKRLKALYPIDKFLNIT